MGDGRIPAKLRRRVRRRANSRCEYCFFPDANSSGPFHCDHVVPQSRGGKTVAENLVWCCAWCNHFKHDRIAAVDTRTRAEVQIFNPRSDHWSDHFKWSSDLLHILARTPKGRATLRLL